jgi:hypothetical protein
VEEGRLLAASLSSSRRSSSSTNPSNASPKRRRSVQALFTPSADPRVLFSSLMLTAEGFLEEGWVGGSLARAVYRLPAPVRDGR